MGLAMKELPIVVLVLTAGLSVGDPARGGTGPEEPRVSAWRSDRGSQTPENTVPRCPRGSTSPQVFRDWYDKAMELNGAEDRPRPLLREQIEANLRILCNCRPRGEGERAASLPPAAGSCVASATTLCLDGRQPGDRRFEVGVVFQTVPANVPCAAGHARPVTGRRWVREGLFWCSEPENPELLIKLEDDCTTEDHFSVVWSVARGVELTVSITDTWTEDEKVYVVDRAGPRTDRRAFSCRPAKAPGPER